MSYTLSISSIARRTRVDNITSQCYIFVDQKRNPIETIEFLILSSLLFGLNVVTECHDLSCSIPIFYVSNHLCRVLRLDSISFVWRLESNHPLLIPANYLYSDVLPFTYTWKMVKDAPNHILMNMIGLAQTSHEILDDGDILISPVVFNTPTRKVYPKATCRS